MRLGIRFLGVGFLLVFAFAIGCGGDDGDNGGGEVVSSDWSGTFKGNYAGVDSSSLTLVLTCRDGRLSGMADDKGGSSTISGTCSASTVDFDKQYTGGAQISNHYMGTKSGDHLEGTWRGAGMGTWAADLSTGG